MANRQKFKRVHPKFMARMTSPPSPLSPIWMQPKFKSRALAASVWVYRRRHWGAVVATLLAIYWCWQAATYLPARSLVVKDQIMAIRLLTYAAIAIGIALLCSFKKSTHPTFNRPPLSPERSRWAIAGVGVVLIAIVTEYNAQFVKIGWPPPLTGDTQLLGLGGGLLLLAWGLGGTIWRIQWREVGVVGSMTLLAFALRVWRLESAVPRFIDELNFATYLTTFWGNNKVGLLWPEIRGFPALYSYLQMHTVDNFGRNLIGLRAVSVVFGTLTIPALYLLIKTLFDRPTAITAALLLATYPPHIHHSRLALNNIADPFWGTLAFAFYARAVHNHRRLDYALAGICLGLTQYFYEGGRLLYPPLMLIWVFMGLVMWRPRWKGLVLMLIAFTIVAAPIYLTLHERDQAFTPRLQSEKLKDAYWENVLENGETDTYLQHLKFSFLAIATQPEWMDYYYGGNYGLVLTALLPILFLGVAIVGWQVHRPSILLIIWVFSAIIGTSFLKFNVLTPRYVVIFPALVALMAVGLRYTPRLLHLPHELQMGLVAIGVIAITVGQTHYYFGDHLTTFNLQSREKYGYDGEDALFRSRDFPAGTHIFLISYSAIEEGYGRGVIHFLSDGMTLSIVEPHLFTEGYISRISPQGDKAFFIEHFDQRSLELLVQHFYLEGPYYSPYSATPIHKQLVLFYAAARNQNQ